MPWDHLIANRGKPVRTWDPRNPPHMADFAYLGPLVATVEDALPERELTLIVTTDHRALPRYGRNVVVIQRAGPDARPPDYAHRVLAVFKTHSARPVLTARPAHEPPALTITALLSYAQLLVLGLSSRMRLRAHAAGARARGRPGPIIESIPLGVMWNSDVACRPVGQRPIDVSFRGSVESGERHGLRRRVGTPKSRSRQAMLAAARRLQAEAPELTIDLALTPSFAASKHADADAYAALLRDTKLCLVPRGDTLETYRLFEAARAGCVVVSEQLPSNWFYDQAPVIDQTGWRGLGYCIRALLADEQALADRQRLTLDWWERWAGPATVGRHVAATVRAALAGS